MGPHQQRDNQIDVLQLKPVDKSLDKGSRCEECLCGDCKILEGWANHCATARARSSKVVLYGTAPWLKSLEKKWGSTRGDFFLALEFGFFKLERGWK